ncbi:MAG: translocation/assembly module TamB domain-containing protein [Bacteroidales bacterium]|nr:translocation/assembly module TamB domain-containing protein [Bacteroidales bacterium]
MRKIIKKIVNIAGWLSLSVLMLMVVASIAVSSPHLQAYMASKAFGGLEDRLGNKLSFNKVKLTIFNKVDFNDLLITDQSFDTILFAQSAKIGFPGLIRKIIFQREMPVKIGSLAFDQAFFRVYVDSSGLMNAQFLFDSLLVARKEQKGSSKPFYINKIKITNSQLAYIRHDSSKRDFGIDFADMRFDNFNLKAKKFVSHADTIWFDVKELSFIEKSGFEIKNCQTSFNYSKKFIRFDKFFASSAFSEYKLDNVYLEYDSIKVLGQPQLFTDVKLSVKFNNSEIMVDELKYFSKFFMGMNQKVNLNGNFNGTLSDLNCRELEVKYGKATRLKGRFDIVGLPSVEHTFVVFDFDGLETNTPDILSFKLPGNKNIKLPEQFNAISNYNYSGNFTGFFKDFVSYGVLKTNLGIIKTDVLFEPDSVNRVAFSGQLSSLDFNIGLLSGLPSLIGNVSFDLKIDGLGYRDKTFNVDIDGDISQFEIYSYNYRNISVDGLLSEKGFNGLLKIDDPNLDLSFDGLVDISSDIRQYKFRANVMHANLYALNIHKKDPEYSGSFLMEADLSGNTLDEINGSLKLLNSFFSKTGAQIQVYDLQLDIQNNSSLNQIKLTSDFFDAQINGHYKLTRLPDEYLLLAKHLLPALTDTLQPEIVQEICDIEYKVSFKNSTPLFRFFTPNYSLAPGTILSGTLGHSSGINATVHLQSPRIKVKNTQIENLVVNSNTSAEGLKIGAGCSMLDLNNRIKFENITVESLVDSNHVHYVLRWLNWDSSLYKGALSGNLSFLNEPGKKTRSLVSIDSSVVVLNDSLWSLSPFTMLLDSNKLIIDNLALRHGNELLTAKGILSDNTNTDSLFCELKTFDFANLNFFTKSSAFRFDGVLNGKAIIKGYSSPLFIASLFVEKLGLNGETIGDTYIDTKWIEKKQAIQVEAKAMRGNLNTLTIIGSYFTKNNNLDFNLGLDKFRLDFVNPYLDNVFDDIRGMATGNLSLKGTPSEPNLNGELNLQKAAFTVDYLKTRYNFTSMLGIANNNLLFDNIEMFDIFGNKAVLNGVIRTEYFKKYHLNLNIKTDKFLCLNTTSSDNNMFFGSAFASGLIRINGEPASLKFDVAARTDAGTIINIPVSETEELSEYNFIKFVSEENASATSARDDYKVNLTGMQLDFNLRVTPEAKVKIIFDPTMGDEMEGTGSGDLRISINTLGDFKMVGEYVIEQGTYLFTLQDVFANWKFNVEQGSTLRWSGDPVNADVNISTYLRRKGSLSDLDPENPNFKGIPSKTIDCIIELSGKLMQPNVKYNIELPFTEQQTRDLVQNYISTDEEKGKQFLALLILKKFLPANPAVNSPSIGGGELANANASELLSNQLSNWLSQISNDVDVGFNYKPGTETSSQEVELALSTQLFNDKLSINSSIDMKTNADAEDATSVVGDVDIDYKITRSGRLRTKVFHRANENVEITLAPHTQGVGLYYTEEFDKLSEVLYRYAEALKAKRKKDKNKTNSQPAKTEGTIPEEE